MAQKKTAKVMAILALIGIIVSIIGTGLLVILGDNTNTQVELTQEQIDEIMKLMEEQKNDTNVEIDNLEIEKTEETIEIN